MPQPDDEDGLAQLHRLAAKTRAGPFRRVFYAGLGLAAGDAALLAFFLLNAWREHASLLAVHMGEPNRQFPAAWEMFWLYSSFSIVGWVLAGVPFALLFPARVLARSRWWLRILIGVALGPVALLLIFVLLLAKQGRLGDLGPGLAQTASLWPFAILVSTISFLVYAALLRRRLSNKGQ